MADFRLTPRNKREEATPAAAVPQSTLLGHVGSAVHTLGSILSAPSRLVHGTINAVTGGEGGFGNLDPLDSTGGIEGSRHLIRAGILAENDPTRWELGDIGRGVADLALDPTSWIGIGGVTKAGSAAAKAGTLTRGLIPAIAKGERALINIRSPLGHALGDIGGNSATAAALTRAAASVSANPIVRRIVQAAPVQAIARGASKVGRVIRGNMDARYNGVIHPDATPFMPGRFDALQKSKRDLSAVLYRIGRQLQPHDEAALAAGHAMTPSQLVHSAMEGVTPIASLPTDLQKHATELKDLFQKSLDAELTLGTKHKGDLHDLIGRDPTTGADIHLGYGPRHTNGASKTATFKREQMLKGFTKGTYAAGGVNDLMKAAAKHAATDPSYLALPTKGDRVNALHRFIESNFGGGKRVADAIADHVQTGFVPPAGTVKPMTLGDALQSVGYGTNSRALQVADDLRTKLADLRSVRPDSMSKRFGKIPAGTALTPDQIAHQATIDSWKQQFKDAAKSLNQHLDKIVHPVAKEILYKTNPGMVGKTRRSVRKAVEIMLGSHVDPAEIQKIALDKLPDQHHLTSTTKVLQNYRMPKGGKLVNRHRELAEYIASKGAPELEELSKNGLFVNAPLADVGRAMTGSNIRLGNAHAVLDILSHHLDQSPTGEATLGKALQGLGYKRRQMGMQIGQKKGLPNFAPNPFDPVLDPQGYSTYKRTQEQALRSLLGRKVDPTLVDQLKFMKPQQQMTAAGRETANLWHQGLNLFKAGILAFPSSRMRDLVSGGVQNVLHRIGSPEAYRESQRLMNGGVLKGDYTHLAEVQDWLRKTGLPATPENQTEAMRQVVAVHLPREHGVLADLPTEQNAYTIGDVVRNVPGQRKSTTYDQFVGAPMRAMTGGSLSDWNPLNVRGVGGRESTSFPPIRASELVSEATDKLNRTAGFLHQVRPGHGAVPEVAAKRVNAAQVSYDPDTFSHTEKFIKRNLAPFYSFSRGVLPATAMQLADFGSPTSQLIKAQTRAYGGDPRVPDYLLDSSGFPLGESPDGTLQYIGGIGLMHEPAAKMIGQAASALSTGNARPLGLNVLSQLNPFLARPIEQSAGVSFSREGEPIANLESNSGRLLANLGVLTGLRDKDAGPVSFPGQNALDFTAGLTPLDRLLGTARSATDTRRGLGKLLTQEEPIQAGQAAIDLARGLAPLTTGLRYTDISPSKQMSTLRGRAEELAKEAGAKSREEVYFPKDALERLRAVNPELAAKQEEIQKYIMSLRLKPKSKPNKTEKASTDFRLKKRREYAAEK